MKNKSPGKEIVDGLKEFLGDLKSNKQIKITKLIKRKNMRRTEYIRQQQLKGKKGN